MYLHVDKHCATLRQLHRLDDKPSNQQLLLCAVIITRATVIRHQVALLQTRYLGGRGSRMRSPIVPFHRKVKVKVK